MLHRRAEEWNGTREELEKLASQLQMACAAAGGVGIAAPQIGVSKQVFLAHLDQGSILAVNPDVVCLGDSTTDAEGCLSIPGVGYRVARSASVRLRALGLEGAYELELHGWDARVVQHEFGHLQGLLISDRARSARS